ncbi:MAG: cbb3-type cytochrome c oxidase N-terminal domain-containing protein [Ferruginibacter sp.]|nr:c-type cytochrome [Bacteroidota bacterium]MBX2919378.1 c-type cytochrome [Ferruginibacter sp.]MCB0709523.1 c-type cytochrome [Chitinophagaceae bacterium]
MQFLKCIKNKILLTLLALPVSLILVAQDTKPVAAPVTEQGYNQLAILLMIVIIVLAFVIWGMGYVLTALGKQLVDKNKNGSKVLSLILLLGFSLQWQFATAQDAVTETVKTVPNYGGLSAAAYYMFLTVIGVEFVVILFLAFSIRRMYSELLPEKKKPAKSSSAVLSWWKKMDSKLFTKAVSVEKEEEILLDHDYDGIRELDNSLPPWWKWGFYITIGVSVVYLLNYHVFGLGMNPTQEYNAEMQKAKIAKEIYDANNKDKIDENNVPFADAAGLKVAQGLYEANCVACHLKDGGGSVGPNFTDNYWLHGGSLNDIYASIKHGYPDKGMQAWGGQFSPKELSFLASYVKSFVGTKPAAGKEQQGVFYVDKAATATDSSATAKPDSTNSSK